MAWNLYSAPDQAGVGEQLIQLVGCLLLKQSLSIIASGYNFAFRLLSDFSYTDEGRMKRSSVWRNRVFALSWSNAICTSFHSSTILTFQIPPTSSHRRLVADLSIFYRSFTGIALMRSGVLFLFLWGVSGPPEARLTHSLFKFPHSHPFHLRTLSHKS